MKCRILNTSLWTALFAVPAVQVSAAEAVSEEKTSQKNPNVIIILADVTEQRMFRHLMSTDWHPRGFGSLMHMPLRLPVPHRDILF